MNTSFLLAPVPQTFLGSSHFHEPLYSPTGAGSAEMPGFYRAGVFHSLWCRERLQ